MPGGNENDDDDVASFSSDGGEGGVGEFAKSLSRDRSYGGGVDRKRKATGAPSKKLAARKRGRSASAAVSPASVDRYFKPAVEGAKKKSGGGNIVVRRELAFAGSPGVRQGDGYGHMREMIDELKNELAEKGEEIVTVREEVAVLERENEDLRTQMLEFGEVKEKAREVARKYDDLEERNAKMKTQLRFAMTESAVARRSEARRATAAACESLGRIVQERSGTSFTEVWEDGTAMRENREKLRKAQADRERLDRKRRELAKVKKVMPPPPPPGSQTLYENSPEYAAEVDEVLKIRAASLKREEVSLLEERSKLILDRDLLLREVDRQSNESSSAFGNYPVVKSRYLLLNLLGRGGFSEVFRAYDFETARFVACKVHQLASNWSEARKQNFLRHMLRENEIHSKLAHPRILRAHDSFSLDNLTVVSVLDLCDGSDLDVVLRKNGALPEREARSIIAQVFAGLVYLDENDVVHYDLKPGNILLDNGQVRITDFGLSKVNTESAADGMMDLTSQGAGTMWYLPPECFVSKGTGGGPRISTKVDVWSAAVILFQCLFGTKPFGNGQSQEQFFRENTASKETLDFPARPAVSDAAKDFIRTCLTRNVIDRPDVRAAAAHPFLRAGRK